MNGAAACAKPGLDGTISSQCHRLCLAVRGFHNDLTVMGKTATRCCGQHLAYALIDSVDEPGCEAEKAVAVSAVVDAVAQFLCAGSISCDDIREAAILIDQCACERDNRLLAEAAIRLRYVVVQRDMEA